MCGIAGIFSYRPVEIEDLGPMLESLHHRGPDDQGSLRSKDQCVALGHTRLSIIDLSPAGSQPMRSQDGRFLLSFNGEIYNFLELRAVLEKCNSKIRFRGTSDTEILIAYIQQFGLKKTLEDVNGMFAFLLWDERDGTLTIARDISGEKPLYYGESNGKLYIASELKSIRSVAKGMQLSHEAIMMFLKLNCVPAPLSIYENFYKLEPATYITFGRPDKIVSKERYFDVTQTSVVDKAQSPEMYVSDFDEVINDAVKRQMVSDVPIGSFLSGGIDSSLVTAVMQENSNKPIKTFSIGFNRKEYNEAPFAKNISKAIGTDHTELYVNDKEMIDVIYDLPNIYCEPFADSSQIPTYLVSKMAKKSVSVALTGDAADELFGGYNRYLVAKKYWGAISNIPYFLRHSAGEILSKIPTNRINQSASFLYSVLNKTVASDIGGKVNKFANILKVRDLSEFHDRTITHWDTEGQLFDNKKHSKPSLYRDHVGTIETVNDMLTADYLGYLHDDNLCKVDRAAMSVSLETRVPFLDKNLIKFAQELPFKYKIRKNESKWILKESLFKKLDKSLFDRPKSGFAIPIHDWLRGDLKDWVNHLFYDLQAEDEELINYQVVRLYWTRFLNGDDSLAYPIWDLIMLRAWLEKN